VRSTSGAERKSVEGRDFRAILIDIVAIRNGCNYMKTNERHPF
jgi:hypothetical protein